MSDHLPNVSEHRPVTLRDALARTGGPLEGVHMTARARLIASLAHQGQLDKIGAPYHGHLARVAARAEGIRGRMSEPLDRHDVEAVAWLHDTLEDTPVTFDELRVAGMPTQVLMAIALLTHRGQPRRAYLEEIAANPLARLVKIADTLDNTDPTRQRSLDEATRERLTVKYAGQLDLLLDAAAGTVTRAMF